MVLTTKICCNITFVCENFDKCELLFTFVAQNLRAENRYGQNVLFEEQILKRLLFDSSSILC